MICERCGHELDSWSQQAPHSETKCIANLRADLAAAEQSRDQWKQAAQNSTDIAMRGTARLRIELTESRKKELDAETRACAAEERAHRLAAALQEMCTLVDRQAEDEGLWFMTKTTSEAYLQQALRRLHQAIEQARAVLESSAVPVVEPPA